MKNLLFFSLMLGLSLLFGSCGDADRAEKISNRFFKLLVDGKIDQAIEMVEYSNGLEDDVKTALEELAENKKSGKLLSAEKSYGFNIESGDGFTNAVLPYSLTYEKGTQTFDVHLIDHGSGFKILLIGNITNSALH